MAARRKLHLIAVLLSLACHCAAQIAVSGRVVDEENSPVADAHVAVHPTASASPVVEAQTDPTGAFNITLPAPGDYLLSVDREGFYALRDRPIQVAAPPAELTITVNSIREVFQSANVNEETSAVEPTAIQHESQLSGTEVNDIPYANSHSFLGSLQLLPEIVPDTTGAPHINGASTSQVLYLLNGFNLTNPISGQFQTALPVEGIRSADLSSGRYSPEYGKGSAGVLAINTASGADTLHYTATDFIPGLSTQQGLHLGNWYPRAGISGPILRHKAWFSDMAGLEYSQAIVNGLPKNANTRSGWLATNILHTQFNLTSANILFADFLINTDNEGRIGLGPLNPVPTTLTVDTRQYLGSVKDQISFMRGALIEFGYARNNYSLTQTPQGQALYVFSPEGNSGNNFENSRQTASRDEALAHAYLPQFHWLGEHRIEAGADADRIHYNGDFHRTGYEVLGLSGQFLSETLYGAPASFGVSDVDASSWLLDTWRPVKRLEFTPGIRQDWDQRIGRSAWSPRLGFSWSPLHSDRATVSGGYAITRDTATMDLFGFPLDQIATTTTPLTPPQQTTFTTTGAHLQMPRAANWNLDLDYRLTSRVFLSGKYLRRRGTDELIYANLADLYAPPSLLPLPGGSSAGTYELTSLRRDDFDSVQFSIRQKFSGQYEWMAAYTHSRAVSNALIDAAAPEPLQVLPYLAPLPWNAPNRLLGWAWLPLPFKNWSIAVLANLRSGFPYSVRDQFGLVEGLVDSYRYPVNFDLNLAIERMITLGGYRFALRGGVDNLTGARNPTAVNNVAGAPGFGEFLGDEGRHFVVRIRFFGHADATSGGPHPKPPPAPAPQPQPEPESNEPPPTATIYGNTGVWKVFTADTLEKHQTVASAWYDRINRNPGDLVISTAGVGGAIGITDRIEFGISLEANRDVSTGRPDELSFGQQALGYFGNKTPGSPPLASELMPGSSIVPQLRSPASPTGALTGAAGYFDLYPFAGLVSSASAAGDILFGLKFKLLSESKGAPFSLAIRPYFDLPIHKAITFLETHPVGTADLQGGFDGILSRDVGDLAELTLNAGYRYISQPAHISVYRLASDVPLGFALVLPRSTRIQFVAESTADIFVGAHTPNTTFGPEDPVDLTLGPRAVFKRRFTLSAGYRRPLNQFGGDKNGFVVSLGYKPARRTP
ncbi:MAG TPA: TonB-dependent receptor [Bryobacteraceae bacterium]|nr:TonB-dependent receptor [Bryobacteraceae bacterium]